MASEKDGTPTAGVVAAGAVAAGTAAAGTLVAAAYARHRTKRSRATHGWQKVTIFLPEAPGELPAPLAELQCCVETEWSVAPGDKGMELAARATGRKVKADQLRAALRESKQLLEVGEVLQADSPGSSQKTLTNKLLREATKQAGKRGHL